MTKQEFLDQVALLYDEVNSNGAPHFEPDEIGTLASKVTEDLVFQKYGPKSNKLGEGYEETEKRIQDLGELVTYQTFTTFSTGYFPNSYNVTLPNTLLNSTPTYTDVFWLPIYESVVTNTNNCAGTAKVNAVVIEAKHAPLDILLEDPFNKPYLKNDKAKVLRLRSNNRTHTLLTDGTFTIQSYKLGYIKKPTPIDLTTSLTDQVSQLAEHVHRELVEETVKLMLKIAREQNQFIIENQLNKE